MRYFIYFFLGLFFAFGVWAFLLYSVAHRPTKTSQWIHDAYEKKEQLAANIKEKKIVIVAGSNALFGINSKLLQEALKMPVLNGSVNAGIELPCILEMAKPLLRDGDIILMPLEYPMYSYDGTPGIQMIDFILSRHPECFFKLTLKEQLYIFWHTPLSFVIDAYLNPSTAPVTKGLYGAHNIDEHGDQIGNTLHNRSKEFYSAVLQAAKKPQHYGAEFSSDALGWFYLEQFMAWSKKHHIRVIFLPSAFLRNDIYRSDKKERWFYENLAQEVQKRGWEYRGNPYEYMYEKESFFNTDFHLIQRVRDQRTEQIIRDLKGAL